MSNILEKIKKAGLVGRGGACFPVAEKWLMVKRTAGEKKYVVCNASEGEPGVEKDGYILEHFPEFVVKGIKTARDFLGAERGFIYINGDYYKRFSRKLTELIGKEPLDLFIKPADSGYIGGEESSLLNALEGKRVEPRLRPPFPTASGLWGSPTLINNVETFYEVGLLAEGKYAGKRFYTLNGDCLWSGVYELPRAYTIEKILKESGNYPRFPFFVQTGGLASGEILNSQQLDRPAAGSGAIAVYSLEKHEPLNLIKGWLEFSLAESCGQCTPCREGVYRLNDIIKAKKPDWRLAAELLDNLAETAFCGLGCAVPVPLKSYAKNVLASLPKNKIKMPLEIKESICECFI